MKNLFNGLLWGCCRSSKYHVLHVLLQLCHVKILIFLEPSDAVSHVFCKITGPMRSRVWELNVIIAYSCNMDKGITECNLPASFFTVWVVWISSLNPKNLGKKKQRQHPSTSQPGTWNHNPYSITPENWQGRYRNDVKLPGLPFSNRKIIFFRLSDQFLGGFHWFHWSHFRECVTRHSQTVTTCTKTGISDPQDVVGVEGSQLRRCILHGMIIMIIRALSGVP